jgi:hypothetical protein
MACIRDLITGFSLRETGFIQSALHVGFVADKVALGTGFFSGCFSSSASFHQCSNLILPRVTDTTEI